MGNVDVTTTIIINKPISEVASYVMQPDNATEWYTNIQSVVWDTPPPLDANSLITFTAAFLGKKMEYTYAIRELIPNEKLVMSTLHGPFPMQTTYSFKATGEHTTEMTLNNQGTPSGFSSLLSLFMVPAMRRANKKDLKVLKEVLEQL